MSDEERLPVTGSHPGFADALRPDDMLSRGFSATEVECLLTWRRRHRIRPNRLDQPADIFRLRFARWLVEHGRLADDVAAAGAGDDGEPSQQQSDGTRALSPTFELQASPASHATRAAAVPGVPERRYRPLLSLFERMCEGIANLYRYPDERTPRLADWQGRAGEGDSRDPNARHRTWTRAYMPWTGLF